MSEPTEQNKPVSTLALIGIIGVSLAVALFSVLIILPFLYNYVMTDLFS